MYAYIVGCIHRILFRFHLRDTFMQPSFKTAIHVYGIIGFRKYYRD